MKASAVSRINKNTFLPANLIGKPYPFYGQVTDIDLAIKLVEMEHVVGSLESFVSVSNLDFKNALTKVKNLNEKLEQLRIDSANGRSTSPCKGVEVSRIFPIHGVKNLLWHLVDAHRSVNHLKSKKRPTSVSRRNKHSRDLKVAKLNVLKAEFELVKSILHGDADQNSGTQFVTVERAYIIASELIGSIIDFRDPRAIRNSINRNLKTPSFRKANGRVGVVYNPASNHKGSKIGCHHGKAKSPKAPGRIVSL